MAEVSGASPERLYTQFAGMALATVSILALVGWQPTRRLAGDNGPTAMILALLVAAAASGIGTLPIWMARYKRPQETISVQLGAMALRMVAILVLGAAVALVAQPELRAFLLWLVIAHAALLIPDTIFARRLVAISAEREANKTL